MRVCYELPGPRADEQLGEQVATAQGEQLEEAGAAPGGDNGDADASQADAGNVASAEVSAATVGDNTDDLEKTAAAVDGEHAFDAKQEQAGEQVATAHGEQLEEATAMGDKTVDMKETATAEDGADAIDAKQEQASEQVAKAHGDHLEEAGAAVGGEGGGADAAQDAQGGEDAAQDAADAAQAANVGDEKDDLERAAVAVDGEAVNTSTKEEPAAGDGCGPVTDATLEATPTQGGSSMLGTMLQSEATRADKDDMKNKADTPVAAAGGDGGAIAQGAKGSYGRLVATADEHAATLVDTADGQEQPAAAERGTQEAGMTVLVEEPRVGGKEDCRQASPTILTLGRIAELMADETDLRAGTDAEGQAPPFKVAKSTAAVPVSGGTGDSASVVVPTAGGTSTAAAGQPVSASVDLLDKVAEPSHLEDETVVPASLAAAGGTATAAAAGGTAISAPPQASTEGGAGIVSAAGGTAVSASADALDNVAEPPGGKGDAMVPAPAEVSTAGGTPTTKAEQPVAAPVDALDKVAKPSEGEADAVVPAPAKLSTGGATAAAAGSMAVLAPAEASTPGGTDTVPAAGGTAGVASAEEGGTATPTNKKVADDAEQEGIRTAHWNCRRV